MRIPRTALLFLAVGCWLLSPSAGLAELATFSLDSTQSVLTISATFAGITVAQQGPGSLTTTYAGTIEADVTSSSITFVGGSLIAGRDNGTWQPGAGGAAGSAPANYGGQITGLASGKAAVRNVLLDVTSAEQAISGGTFPSQALQFNFVPNVTSVIDYTYSSIFGSGSGSQALTGTSTNSIATNATVIAQGAETVLTIPVDISGAVTVINANDLQYRFRGRLVGRAIAPVPLQINSFQISPGQLNFTIATTPGQSFTILSSTNLTDWSTAVDQFTATNNPTIRSVSIPGLLPSQYFRVRWD